MPTSCPHILCTIHIICTSGLSRKAVLFEIIQTALPRLRTNRAERRAGPWRGLPAAPLHEVQLKFANPAPGAHVKGISLLFPGNFGRARHATGAPVYSSGPPYGQTRTPSRTPCAETRTPTQSLPDKSWSPPTKPNQPIFTYPYLSNQTTQRLKCDVCAGEPAVSRFKDSIRQPVRQRMDPGAYPSGGDMETMAVQIDHLCSWSRRNRGFPGREGIDSGEGGRDKNRTSHFVATVSAVTVGV